MSWLDNLLGTDSDNQSNNGNLNDKDIALDMLISSKMDIVSLTNTLTETTNPQLRQMLSTQLTNCINQHFRLSDMAINKQWYNSYSNPQQQLQQDIKEVQNLSQQGQQDQQSQQGQQDQQSQQGQQDQQNQQSQQ